MKVDLQGPNGNAYVLRGIADSLGKQLGRSQEAREALDAQMRASTYDDLLSAMEAAFPHVLEFVNDPRQNTGFGPMDGRSEG